MSVIDQYLQKCQLLTESIGQQKGQLQTAAQWFANTIIAGRMVHVFGSGHSRIMAEEMWPRYGSFPGFNPIVELSLTFHNLVVGANGQRQAMYLENVEGLAERILRNFYLTNQDSALVISSSGCNVVPIEIAQIFQEKGIKVVVLVSLAHLEESTSKRSDGLKLTDFADSDIRYWCSGWRRFGGRSRFRYSGVSYFHSWRCHNYQLSQGRNSKIAYRSRPNT